MDLAVLAMVRGVPPVTRTMLISIAAVSFLEYAGLVTVQDLWYNFNEVYYKKQYWRLVTCFLFVNRLNWSLAFAMYFLHMTSTSLEATFHDSKKYLKMIFIIGAVHLILSHYTQTHALLGNRLAESLSYMWACRNSDAHIGFFGVLSLPARYLILYNLVMKTLIYNIPISIVLCEILASNTYMFFEDVVPKLYGLDVFSVKIFGQLKLVYKAWKSHNRH